MGLTKTGLLPLWNGIRNARRSGYRPTDARAELDEHSLQAAFNQILLQNLQGGFTKVSDILRATDLRITAQATGIDSDLDLHGASFQFTMQAANSAALAAGETLFLYVEADNWKDMSKAKMSDWAPRLLRNGLVEIAIVDRNKRLIDRFSISIWTNDGEDLYCTNPNAPIKRWHKEALAEFDSLDTRSAPIDIVYTWVNAADPEWRAMITPYREPEALDLDRYLQTDELKYSLRSVFAFMPWVRTVHVFTNCAPPDWFIESERVRWVQHKAVIPARHLPLFNSHSIEMFLHEIPGLAEQYVYFNDDVFAAYFLRPQDFFTPYGQSISRMEPHGSTPHFAALVKAGRAQEWQHAALNGARLLQQWRRVFPTNMHRHVPHAFCKATYAAMLEQFPEQAEQTRGSRFRAPTDVSFTSFLYHHYALALGKSSHIDEDGPIVRACNYRSFQRRKTYLKTRFFCVNDGGGSAQDAGFQQFKARFLEERFAFKSPAER